MEGWGTLEVFFKGEKHFLSVSSTLFSYELIRYALSVFREICVFLKWTTMCSVLRGKKKTKGKTLQTWPCDRISRHISIYIHLTRDCKANTKQFPD